MRMGRKKGYRDQTGLDSHGKVDWRSPVNLSCLLLVDYGLSAKAISRATGLSCGKIQYRCLRGKRKIRDYRNGKGQIARVLVQRYNAKRISSSDVRSLRKMFVVPVSKSGNG